jgi:hypothetical protein
LSTLYGLNYEHHKESAKFLTYCVGTLSVAEFIEGLGFDFISIDTELLPGERYSAGCFGAFL